MYLCKVKIFSIPLHRTLICGTSGVHQSTTLTKIIFFLEFSTRGELVNMLLDSARIFVNLPLLFGLRLVRTKAISHSYFHDIKICWMIIFVNNC